VWQPSNVIRLPVDVASDWIERRPGDQPRMPSMRPLPGTDRAPDGAARPKAGHTARKPAAGSSGANAHRRVRAAHQDSHQVDYAMRVPVDP
jgi:hypothetical protein